MQQGTMMNNKNRDIPILIAIRVVVVKGRIKKSKENKLGKM
jgi:hypothetical protein